jgi:hypothetical protein
MPQIVKTCPPVADMAKPYRKIRWMIEQVISHFKNWTIMHTDYRTAE